MKKINILVILASILSLSFTINVNAANKTVDASVCKDGKVYTNYYYFLSADYYHEENADSYGIKTEHGEITTQGIFHNNIIKVEAAKENGLIASNGITKAYGKIPISTSASNGFNNKNLIEFYQEFLQYSSHTNGSWTEADGVTSRMVTHSWAKLAGNSQWVPQDYQVIVVNHSAVELANASIDMPSTFADPYVIQNGDPVTDIAFNITRNYGDSSIKPFVESSSYTYIESETSGQVKKWIFNPSLYYIQYCETAVATPTQDTFVVRYHANAGDDEVTNVPATSAITNVGTVVQISSTKPKRDGYTFLGWSTNANATKADANYSAGTSYAGANGDLDLYAIWKGNTTENPGTGIASHIAAYVIVIALGVGGLALARKKGLFRQI